MKSHLQKGDAEITLLNNKLQTAQGLLQKQKIEMENEQITIDTYEFSDRPTIKGYPELRWNT